MGNISNWSKIGKKESHSFSLGGKTVNQASPNFLQLINVFEGHPTAFSKNLATQQYFAAKNFLLADSLLPFLKLELKDFVVAYKIDHLICETKGSWFMSHGELRSFFFHLLSPTPSTKTIALSSGKLTSSKPFVQNKNCLEILLVAINYVWQRQADNNAWVRRGGWVL